MNMPHATKKLKDFLPVDDHEILAAQRGGIICHLDAAAANEDHIKWITIHSEAGERVYQRTLSLILFVALEELYPHLKIRILYSISNAFYFERVDGFSFSSEEIEAIEVRMREIVSFNEKISLIYMPKKEAIHFFQTKDQWDTVQLFKELDEEEIPLYQCRNTIEYIHEPVADVAGKISLFKIQSSEGRIIIHFPNFERGEETFSPFIPQRKLENIFKEANRWAEILSCPYVSSLNEYIKSDQLADLIDMSEAFHTQKIVSIADLIAAKRKEARLICIAGPSSSGKTTFASRLRTYLRINGFNPITVSMDDYFKNRKDSPRNPDGSYDFETIDALDLDLFNLQLQELLDEKEIISPRFNFVTGEREWKNESMKVSAGDFIIIEGIHGLNEKLTYKIPRSKKIKIYVSALTQLALDNHNRLSTTDTRLIRRLVRDFQFRGATAERTLQMWRSVREGEEKYIFPFQEEADIMFNSTLLYELAILKHWAYPLLLSVPKESDSYPMAQELLHFLKCFREGDLRLVSSHSLLREFVGENQKTITI